MEEAGGCRQGEPYLGVLAQVSNSYLLHVPPPLLQPSLPNAFDNSNDRHHIAENILSMRWNVDLAIAIEMEMDGNESNASQLNMASRES
jgi:hypothetical protein